MAFYTGKSNDGSDIKRFSGFHVSKCGKYWGSSQDVADNAWKMDVPESRFERRKRQRYGM